MLEVSYNLRGDKKNESWSQHNCTAGNCRRGNPVNLNGTQITNPNSSGSGRGSADVGSFGGNLNTFFTVVGSLCAVTTTVRVSGVEVGTYRGFLLC